MNKLNYFILSACLVGTIVAQGDGNQSHPQRISRNDAIVLYMREVAIPASEILPKELEEKKNLSCRMAADYQQISLSVGAIADDGENKFEQMTGQLEWSCARARESMDALSKRGVLDGFSRPILEKLAVPFEQKMQKDYGFRGKDIELIRKKALSFIPYEHKPIIKRNFFLKEL